MSERFPIAYVAGSFPLRSETFVWREVRELRRRGWTVHTFGLRQPDESTPQELADLREGSRYIYDGVDRPPVPVRLRGSFLPALDAMVPGERTAMRDRLKLLVQANAGFKLARWLMHLQVRHVHAHFAHAPTTVGMYAARFAGVPFSFTGHANDLFQRRQLLTRKLQRAAFIACISEWHREWYQSIWPNGRYEIIRCGVPLEDYRSPPEPADELRVLTVARLVEKKGIDTLLRAAAEVEGVRITVAGDGPQAGELAWLGDELGLGERVSFLGAVDNSRVPALLAEHDAFALPCRPDRHGDRDGIPVALMEAMATGLAVLAGDLPAIRELVEEDQTGRLVATETASLAQQARQVTRILRAWRQDVAARRRLGEQGRERVTAAFSLAANVDRLETSIRKSAVGAHTCLKGR